MRVVAAVFGSLMFVVGLLMLGVGAGSALNTNDHFANSDPDWTCSVVREHQDCSFGINSAPRLQAEIMTDLAVTVTGATVAICGAIFLLIGTNRSARINVSQPALAPMAAGYPRHPGQQSGPPAGAPHYPPQG